MKQYLDFYINGQWVPPVELKTIGVINPATEAPFATISLGSAADVDKAVQAARTAFETYSQTSVAERVALLKEILIVYKKRYDDIGDAILKEMGAPRELAYGLQTSVGIDILESTINMLENFEFETTVGNATIIHEPIGVCGLITPWNWPIDQLVSKVVPALAAGCTMILKPSEIAPIDALIFAEIVDEAGVPAGVFNLVNGMGPEVGEAMSAHPGIDMMSFTGSTRGGVAVAESSAKFVKRISQELGGKSPNIILETADFAAAVATGVQTLMHNLSLIHI